MILEGEKILRSKKSTPNLSNENNLRCQIVTANSECENSQGKNIYKNLNV